ncbi:MAG: TetR/AcrR family transcriptional regulator [Acidobacteria bacterium]|nr:MAG: TetR/AcrR family transcriptional regulator [Acidobacteriota bacterium]
MPSVTRRVRPLADRRAVESRVLNATTGLLDGGASYTELSVGAIADASGIARSTFYVHFADKTALLTRLVAEAVGDLFAITGEWFGDDDDDGPAVLAKVLRRFVAGARARRQILAAVIETMAYDAEVEALWVSQVDVLAEHIHSRIAAAKEAGYVAQDVDVDLLTSIAAWTVERNVVRQVLAGDPRTDPEFADALARALWLMIFGDAPTPA